MNATTIITSVNADEAAVIISREYPTTVVAGESVRDTVGNWIANGDYTIPTTLEALRAETAKEFSEYVSE